MANMLILGPYITGVDQYRIPVLSIDFNKIYDTSRPPRQGMGDGKKAETFYELH